MRNVARVAIVALIIVSMIVCSASAAVALREGLAHRDAHRTGTPFSDAEVSAFLHDYFAREPAPVSMRIDADEALSPTREEIAVYGAHLFLRSEYLRARVPRWIRDRQLSHAAPGDLHRAELTEETRSLLDRYSRRLSGWICHSRQTPEVLIGTDQTFNAFSNSRGVVVVHTGLIDVLGTGSPLMAVLSHELGHEFRKDVWSREMVDEVVNHDRTLLHHLSPAERARFELLSAYAKKWAGRERESTADLLGAILVERMVGSLEPVKTVLRALARHEAPGAVNSLLEHRLPHERLADVDLWEYAIVQRAAADQCVDFYEPLGLLPHAE